LPFLPLFHVVIGITSSHIRNSSWFAEIGNLTFRVMGGKSGKIAARSGNEVATKWQRSGNEVAR